ncbi:phospholipase D family protein [Pseudonocardia acidicola]|uniref:PLD phosphodiesterase domain-containing protein n=1 Tax=Pseudonocardia acidicola TaxID=2724939 RepID=A0ABX1SBS6_9PSEU|nr:phospholipase D family protein [Pseudonocardia acidicola]NMH97992.1 hypothetical protein [Pseudonocardia acidicola]
MTTIEHSDFASPLTLLRQWRDRPDGVPLREFLVLGFTADLVFLERFAISLARQMGARVTVLSDADQQIHDPIDVRFAGHIYQHGAVTIRGAFHPKLAVLVGDKDVWTAIGSGNPTMSGWGHNHELWCVLRGGKDSGLRAQAELGEWLQRLPRHVAMPSWIAETVTNIGLGILPAQVDDSRPDVRLLHNLDAPLLDRLPTEAAEVNLAAPFVDPSGAAVRAILERARPSRVRVALQSQLSSFDGRTLTAATSRTKAEFREVDDERTMHGKLIELVGRDGRHRAVVGSANVTSAALLRTVRDGGNCELAIAADVGRSLLPDARRVSPTEVAQWRPSEDHDREVAHPPLRLLGARRLERAVELLVVCGVAGQVTVEFSPDGAPGSWQPRGVFDVSAVGAPLMWTVDSPEPAGAAVRLVAMVDGAAVESVPAFVTDPHRCRPRTDVGAAPQLRNPPELDSVIKDPGLLERFGRDLLNLLQLSAEQRATTAALRKPSSASGGVDAQSRKDAWTEFLDLAAHSLGASLTEMVFPGALPTPTNTVDSSTWAVGMIEDETELAEDETESAIEQLDPLVGREARRVKPEARSRYRSWIRRWVKAITPGAAAPVPPLPMRMTVAALYLELLAAGVWGSDDGWRDELADVVLALVADQAEITDSPEESHAYLGSLVALCLAVLGHNAVVRGGRPADVVLTRAWEPAHQVATLAEDVVIDSLLLRSDEAGARLAGRSEVDAVVELAHDAATDPQAETLAGLAAAGLEVEREHGAWIVRGTFRNPMRPAARAATELFDGDPLTCVATTGTRSVIMTRGEDAVAMLDSAVGRWRVYPLRRPSTPLTLFGQGEGVPATRQILAARPVPPAVAAIAGDGDLENLLAKFGPGRKPRSKDGAWTDRDW